MVRQGSAEEIDLLGKICAAREALDRAPHGRSYLVGSADRVAVWRRLVEEGDEGGGGWRSK